MKTGLILDLSNLYTNILKAFGRGSRLRVVSLVEQLEAQGHILVGKAAYSGQYPDDAHKFVGLLQSQGFETWFDATDWSMAMALKSATFCDIADCIIICSSDNRMWRAMDYAKNRGKIVKCISVNTPNWFKQFATVLPLDNAVITHEEANVPATIA